ncbi:MAG: response regulator transcription factor [Betaproteobacteria bacterium]|nr:response regulator transcription factor [Betaproteobacteria bacterium]
MQSGAAEKRPLVLVIEDDDQIALFIRHVLERSGYEVRVAADGKEAEALIGHMEPPSVVTLDIDLPHMSGDELMLRIKTAPGWERVRVIMVTATPKTADSTWAVKTGARAYLVKPFKPEELVETVGRLIAPKKPAA